MKQKKTKINQSKTTLQESNPAWKVKRKMRKFLGSRKVLLNQ